ncbi:hypothetical protein [Nonomuraea sp. NPDC050691]|uniref:hypothetical protein n=1 Tax=Nonomuraea sp. NPDC050691 TaxID=3155661 RepID=UPI0033FBDDBF
MDDILALAADSAQRVWAFGTTAPPGEDDVVRRMFISTLQHGRWDDVVVADEDTLELDWSTVGARSGWATVDGLVLRWNGRAWVRQPGKPSFGQGDDMWALSGDRTVLRWEGTGWRKPKLPALGTRALGSRPQSWLSDLVPYGRDDTWAVGNVGWDMDNENYEDDAIRARPVAIHWNGSSWACTWGPMHRTFRAAAPDGLWVIAESSGICPAADGPKSSSPLPPDMSSPWKAWSSVQERTRSTPPATSLQLRTTSLTAHSPENSEEPSGARSRRASWSMAVAGGSRVRSATSGASMARWRAA